MARIDKPDDEPAEEERRPGLLERASPAPLMRIVSGVLDRLKPTTYVEWSEAPDTPESPYRARLNVQDEPGSEGLEVREREVVRGEWNTIYEIRCACGKRWFNRQFENIQLCPRCGCAVLLNPDDKSETP